MGTRVRRPGKHAALPLVLSLLIGSGCGGAGPFAGDGRMPPFSRQLVIKFKPGTVACDPAGIARLSGATRVPLEFVRTMSGGACVVRQFADGEDDLLRGQGTLKGNPAVEYVEPDAVMKAL